MRNKGARFALVAVLGICAALAGSGIVDAVSWSPVGNIKAKRINASGPVVLTNTVTMSSTVNLSGAFQIGGVAVTATAAELNVLDGATVGTAVASKALVLSTSKNTDTIKIDNFVQFLAHDTEPGTTEGMLYADDSDNKLKYYNGSGWVNLVTGGGSGDNTLDLAYREGGAGAGAKIDVDGGTVEMEVDDGDNTTALFLDGNDVTNDPTVLLIDNIADAANAITVDIDAQSTGRDIEGSGALWYITGAGLGWYTSFVSPSIASASSGNVALSIDAAGTGIIRVGQTSTGLVQVDRRFDALDTVNLGDAAGDAVSIVGSIVADVTIDDGVTDSPSLIFQDATNETAAFLKTDAGRLGLTTDASDGLNVLTGNLWVGNSVAGTAAMDGEDAYIEGELEVDGAVQFDGAVTFASTTTFTGAVASTVATMATTVDEGSTFERNQATTTSDLVTITVTNASDDEQALVIDHNATAAVDAMQIENTGTAAALHITGEVAGSVALDVDVAASATARAIFLDLGTWLGSANEGAIEIVSDSAGHIPAGQMLRIQQQGTGQHAAAIDGSSLYVEDDATAPGAGTSFAVNIDAALIEALHIDAGTSLFDEVATFTAGIDADADVDVDFDVNTEEVDVTTSVTDYGADSAVATIYASGAGQTNATYLLRLRHATNADAQDNFIVMEDNDGDDMFKVDSSGEMTVAGASTFTTSIDVPVGGFELSSVAVTPTAAELNAVDIGAAGTAEANKAIVLNAGKEIATITAATITTVTSTTVDSATVTNASLDLESLNPMTIKLNDTDALALDNSAITGFAAAADVAGNGVYMETEDGGIDTAVDGAIAGGLYSFKTGEAGAAGTDQVGADGGAYSATTGAGSAADGSGATGGAGGAWSGVAGVGGAIDTGATAGGAGGAWNATAGTGGAATAGAGDGGVGGIVTITAGLGGASSGGDIGAPGKVKIAAGNLHYTNAQTLDMSDAEVALTLVPGTPTGTTITSNVMYVDANSASVEDLLLPPEAGCNGLELLIKNTGGEDIIVKEDSDTTDIATVPPLQSALFICDGTTWSGGVAPVEVRDPGAHGMGSIDFNITGVGGMVVTINSVTYTEAGAEDFPNGQWTNGASAADSAASLISAINGDTRTTILYTALADESTGGLVIIADAIGTGGNFTLASDNGAATVSAGAMTGGAAATIKRQATYEHTVTANDALLENVDIPLPFVPVGFVIQTRSSTGLHKALTDLVTIEASPNRLRVNKDAGTNVAAGDIINVIAWN